MEALVPAFVVVLLAGCSDRLAWLAAMLSGRSRHPARVIAGVGVALAIALAAAAAAGAQAAPAMTPNARGLLVAGAFVVAGVACLVPKRPPLSAVRLGAFFGGMTLVISDSGAVLVFAFAARSAAPALAAAGGIAAGLVIASAAVMMAEAQWRALPHRAIGIAAGTIFIVLAAITAFSALRLL